MGAPAGTEMPGDPRPERLRRKMGNRAPASVIHAFI